MKEGMLIPWIPLMRMGVPFTPMRGAPFTPINGVPVMLTVPATVLWNSGYKKTFHKIYKIFAVDLSESADT